MVASKIEIINKIFKDSIVTTKKDMTILYNLEHSKDQHSEKIIDIIINLYNIGFTNIEFHDFQLDGIYEDLNKNKIKYIGITGIGPLTPTNLDQIVIPPFWIECRKRIDGVRDNNATKNKREHRRTQTS